MCLHGVYNFFFSPGGTAFRVVRVYRKGGAGGGGGGAFFPKAENEKMRKG